MAFTWLIWWGGGYQSLGNWNDPRSIGWNHPTNQPSHYQLPVCIRGLLLKAGWRYHGWLLLCLVFPPPHTWTLDFWIELMIVGIPSVSKGWKTRDISRMVEWSKGPKPSNEISATNLYSLKCVFYWHWFGQGTVWRSCHHFVGGIWGGRLFEIHTLPDTNIEFYGSVGLLNSELRRIPFVGSKNSGTTTLGVVMACMSSSKLWSTWESKTSREMGLASDILLLMVQRSCTIWSKKSPFGKLT